MRLRLLIAGASRSPLIRPCLSCHALAVRTSHSISIPSSVLSIAVFPVVLVDQVALVRHKTNDDIVVRELPDLLEPISKVDERLNIAHIVHEEGSNCEPIMRCRDAQELFGTRRVPDLGPYGLIAIWQRNVLDNVFYAVCRLRLCLIDVLAHSEQEIRFAYPFISNYDDFIEVVE